MKRLILGVTFAAAIGASFAFSNPKESAPAEDFIECERATLSCGVSGVACGQTKEEVKQVIKNAEDAICSEN
ncbi:beta/alpha barrel domain-containing protein [Tenacibaculum litopenaei]|uniref:hypothetical protein n=1 Tax=Tenacibaculum litopenaei TaxID=396016 RepID=UPI0038B5494A